MSFTSDDFEPNSIYEARTRRARKARPCGECDTTIAAGEQYEYVSALADGSWAHYVTCSECLALRAKFFPECYPHGNLRQCIREAVDS